jgi:hypothetical protein
VKGGKSPHKDLKIVPNYDNHPSETVKFPLENVVGAPMDGLVWLRKIRIAREGPGSSTGSSWLRKHGRTKQNQQNENSCI